MFMSFLKNKITLLQQNSVTDWCSSWSAPVWRLHSLGKTFLRISRIRNIPLIGILARLFVYVPPFISQILDFIYRIFILIYFEWRDTENQPLSNHCANLKSRKAKLVITKFLDHSRAYTNNKKNQKWKEVVNPFITPWDKPFVEKRHGNVRSVSMDYTVIKQRDLRSFYLLSTRNHFTLKYLMADLGGQEIMVQRSLWRNQCNHIFKISVAVKQYEDCFLFDSGPRVFH